MVAYKGICSCSGIIIGKTCNGGGGGGYGEMGISIRNGGGGIAQNFSVGVTIRCIRFIGDTQVI